MNLKVLKVTNGRKLISSTPFNVFFIVTFEESLTLSFCITPLRLGTRERGVESSSLEKSPRLIKLV